MEDAETRLRESWLANAAPWTRAVREGRIPSRRAGTDAAVVECCAALIHDVAAAEGHRPRVLDVGCGEGWLTRALADRGADVLGVDGSAPLVDAARAAAASAGAAQDGHVSHARYAVATYEQLAGDAGCAPGPWDVVVCNFALLGDPLAPLLGALRQRLAPRGWLVIQTVHPWSVAEGGRYESGWREERFDAFDEPFPAAMPWYQRTLASWMAELRAAGLAIHDLREPVHPETRTPLSLLLLCAAATRRPTSPSHP